MCDVETSEMRRPYPTSGCCAKREEIQEEEEEGGEVTLSVNSVVE
jgi:hypothetical protein